MHIALPFDLLNEEITNPVIPSFQDFAREVTLPDAQTLQTIIDTLASAERPVILTGPLLNPTRAQGLLEKLADAVDAPALRARRHNQWSTNSTKRPRNMIYSVFPASSKHSKADSLHVLFHFAAFSVTFPANGRPLDPTSE